jgi:hypothetical protein
MPKDKATIKPTAGAENNVVITVFEDFITALSADSSIEPAGVARLKAALLVQQDLSPEAIRQALFSEDPLP